MKISWDTKYMGTWNLTCEDSEVMGRLESLSKLGFDARVEMLDSTDDV